MPTTEALKVSGSLYLVLILIGLIRTRNLNRFALELLPLVGLIILDILIASVSTGYVTFGAANSPSLGTIAIIGGVAARYIFYLKGAFNWLDFLKPLCISPLLLLPLMGSLQSIQKLEPIQIISFALIAFQNGFFWQAVLAKSKPRK